MRFQPLLATAVVALTAWLAAGPLLHAQDYAPRGLFGPRTVGGPIVPGERDRFSRGIQRSRSGSILGLQRDRYVYPRPEPLFAEPLPPTIVVVPHTPQWQPPVQPPRAVRPTPASPPAAPPQTRSAPLPDTWFRNR